MGNNLDEVLWPGFKRICPSARLGGINANKPGYHNTRGRLLAQGRKNDYSVAQFAADKRGPADQPCAIDLTFPDAQAGNYSTIKVYSKRLYIAGQTEDPRTHGWREFFGNTDNDTEVEGWDFSKNRPSSSDKSHLWHIHLSEHRDGILIPGRAHAMLSLLSGEPLGAYEQRTKRDVIMADIDGKLPVLHRGDEDPVKGVRTSYVKRAQAILDWLTSEQVATDGVYGPVMARAVREMMADDKTRSSNDGSIIGEPEWRRLYGLWA